MLLMPNGLKLVSRRPRWALGVEPVSGQGGRLFSVALILFHQSHRPGATKRNLSHLSFEVPFPIAIETGVKCCSGASVKQRRKLERFADGG